MIWKKIITFLSHINAGTSVKISLKHIMRVHSERFDAVGAPIHNSMTICWRYDDDDDVRETLKHYCFFISLAHWRNNITRVVQYLYLFQFLLLLHIHNIYIIVRTHMQRWKTTTTRSSGVHTDISSFIFQKRTKKND